MNSAWADEPVACPACGAAQLARVARGAHATRAPEIRAQILARTFHVVTCTACGKPFRAHGAMVYTDMDRRHWIQVAHVDERIRWPEWERATDQLFERAFTGSPYAHGLRDGFRVRVVFGLEELREKLVVWDANLGDAAIEVLKLDVIAHEPQLMHARIVVDQVRADGAIELAVELAGRRTRREIAGAIVEDAQGDPQLARRFPELYAGRYVCTERLLGPRAT